MIFIIVGCLAFLVMSIFDLNQIYWCDHRLNHAFSIGMGILVVATLGVLVGDYGGYLVPGLWQVIFGIMALISLFLLLGTLFFWLPFNDTYLDTARDKKVINTGMYALCRHPGVIWFFTLYIFLWLATGKTMVLWAAIIWTATDVLYVFVQDSWFFPKTLAGYKKYQAEVPFLVPSRDSLYKCVHSLARKR